MNSAVYSGETVTLIRLDGQPTVVFSRALPSGSNLVSDREFVATVNRILAGTAQPSSDIRALAPQADMLDALALAAATVPVGGDVIVVDSGLQTTQPLNFRDGLLGDDPHSIAGLLRGAGELPNLEGRHVYFVGLGWTAPPQPQLSIADRSKLVNIWSEITKAAGASCFAIDQTPNTRNAIPGRPPVAVVTQPPLPIPIIACSAVRLNGLNRVGFQLNSAVFNDPFGARATLRQLANVILRTGESVNLAGSTSSEGSDAFNLQLSLDRANAVKAVLIQLGVPASRITTRGDGSHLPGRINDRGPNGQLLTGPAIQDRMVLATLSGRHC